MKRDYDGMTILIYVLATILLSLIFYHMGYTVGANRERTNDESHRWHDVGTGGQGQGRETGALGAEPNAGQVPQTRPAGAVLPVSLSADISRLQAAAPDYRGGRIAGVGSPARRLFTAIAQVESGNRDRPPVGDFGRSHGPYQMGLACYLDSGGLAADFPAVAYDRAKTEAAMVRYWARYKAVTDEARSRIWNGGPAGMKKAATVAYWNKVKGAMKCQ